MKIRYSLYESSISDTEEWEIEGFEHESIPLSRIRSHRATHQQIQMKGSRDNGSGIKKRKLPREMIDMCFSSSIDFISPEQIQVMNHAFRQAEGKCPPRKEIKHISQQTGLSQSRIKRWYEEKEESLGCDKGDICDNEGCEKLNNDMPSFDICLFNEKAANTDKQLDTCFKTLEEIDHSLASSARNRSDLNKEY